MVGCMYSTAACSRPSIPSVPASPIRHPKICSSCSRSEQPQICNKPFTQKIRNGLLGTVLSLSLFCTGANARLDPVNRPDLLPNVQSSVIDVAGFLTTREEATLTTEIKTLEADTGIKLRLLAQSYPETPGLAVKDYWNVDDDTIVFVADPTFGGILNFNVGANVDLRVPRTFWSKLSGKFGNKFYWKEKGENVPIINAVGAIDMCLREPPSKFQCSKVEESNF